MSPAAFCPFLPLTLAFFSGTFYPVKDYLAPQYMRGFRSKNSLYQDPPDNLKCRDDQLSDRVPKLTTFLSCGGWAADEYALMCSECLCLQ